MEKSLFKLIASSLMINLRPNLSLESHHIRLLRRVSVVCIIIFIDIISSVVHKAA